MILNSLYMQKQTRRCKEQDRNIKLFLKERPYHNFTGNLTLTLQTEVSLIFLSKRPLLAGYLTLYHGQFNNSLIQNQLPTKRQLKNLNGLHDLDLFRRNSNLDGSLNTNNNLSNQQIYSCYYYPYNFNENLNIQIRDKMETSFLIFRDIISFNHNLAKLQTNFLSEVDQNFSSILLDLQKRK